MPDFRNHVELTGRVDRDPELRRFDSGKCNLTIRLQTSARGDWQRVVVWDSDAERMESVEIGAWITLVGRNQTRTYEKDGEKRYITEVVARTISRLDASCEQPGAEAEPPRPASANPPALEEGDDAFPF